MADVFSLHTIALRRFRYGLTLHCNRFPEVERMQKIILTVAALGFIAIVVTVAPDIRRYMRIRNM
jgi:hypothetical protein